MSIQKHLSIFLSLLSLGILLPSFSFAVTAIDINGGVAGTSCDYTSQGIAYEKGVCDTLVIIQGTKEECKSGSIVSAINPARNGQPCGTSSVCSLGMICIGGTQKAPIASSSTYSGLVPCGGPNQEECTLCHLFSGIQGIIDWGMRILTTIAIVILVAMAILYIVSSGNSQMMETAKTGIKNTLIGFGIVLLAWVIINATIVILPINKSFVTKNWWTIDCKSSAQQLAEKIDQSTNLPFKLSSSNITFPNTTPGVTNTSQTITLSAIKDFTFSTIKFDPQIADSYKIINNTCKDSLDGQDGFTSDTCTFQVQITPTDCTEKKGNLTLTTQEGTASTTTTLPLSGQGIGCNTHLALPNDQSRIVSETEERTLSLPVTLSRSTSTAPVTLTYHTENGSAQAGTHYQTTSGTLTWNTNEQGTKNIDIPLKKATHANTEAEANKTFTLSYSATPGTSLSNTSITITLTNEGWGVIPPKEPEMPEIPADKPCNTDGSGGGCLGQTSGGRWISLADELAGKITEAVFVPRASAYTIAIYNEMGKENDWGCGPEDEPRVRTKTACDFTASLRGDVTYVLRTHLIQGGYEHRPTFMQFLTAQTLDELGSYLFAVSADPSTRIDPAKRNGPDECRLPTEPNVLAGFAPSNCDVLMSIYTEQPLVTKTVYLKFQAYGTNPLFGNKAPSQCNNGIRCAMYTYVP